MTPDIPADLVVFALSMVGFLAIGLPLIMHRVSVPARFEFEPIADRDLSAAQSSYFARLDAELRELDYLPGGNWKPVNMQGQALLRLFFSPIDPAVVIMNLLTSDPSLGNEQSVNFLEIVTRYRDGTILSTRNADVSDVLDQLPDHILIERRGIRDPARLKKVHDAKSAELLQCDPIHGRPEDFERVFNEHHERWCAHQLERGLLRPSPRDPEVLKPTVKTGLRGIFNFLNPLADNFTPLRFLLVALLGMVIPGAAIFWLGGPDGEQVARMAAAIGLEPGLVFSLCLTVVFAVSGAIVGLVFVGKSFVWSFLFTYVLLRLIADIDFLTTFLLCMWAGIVADLVARWRLAKNKLT